MSAALVGAGQRFGGEFLQPEPETLEIQLQELNVPKALLAMDSAVGLATNSEAWSDSQWRNTASFLSLSAGAVGLEVVDINLLDGPLTDGFITVDAVVRLTGDSYSVPLFLASASRHRLIATVEQVAVSSERGGESSIQVQFRYEAPTAPDASWLEDSLSLAGSGALSALPVFQKALHLREWKRFNRSLPDMRDRANSLQIDVQRTLPAKLISTRLTGGDVSWNPNL